ncbi:hypothetical protein PUN28_008153 [Cardiocondyla obscurior]|uniref:Uncharacterized protein n=1 Tax=Cardiocondyla obscurior TaxID=286306 RepID=A0AAW2G1N6_9HYME
MILWIYGIRQPLQSIVISSYSVGYDSISQSCRLRELPFYTDSEIAFHFCFHTLLQPNCILLCSLVTPNSVLLNQILHLGLLISNAKFFILK